MSLTLSLLELFGFLFKLFFILFLSLMSKTANKRLKKSSRPWLEGLQKYVARLFCLHSISYLRGGLFHCTVRDSRICEIRECRPDAKSYVFVLKIFALSSKARINNQDKSRYDEQKLLIFVFIFARTLMKFFSVPSRLCANT